MVNNSGQIYTIEGVAAGILMVFTAYLVINSTTIITPQDIHITDLQIEQLGNDALAVLDTPNSSIYNPNPDESRSLLQHQIENDGGEAFGQNFSLIINSKVSPDETDNLKYNATICYRDIGSGEIRIVPFNCSSEYFRENAVNVKRWVYINPAGRLNPFNLDQRDQVVLVEVLLWRG